MLRRPPTSLELKLDDIVEYETLRRNQEALKKGQAKPYNEPPKWNPGPKSKSEVYGRIGYAPSSQNDDTE